MARLIGAIAAKNAQVNSARDDIKSSKVKSAFGEYKVIPVDSITEDPDNAELYGEYEIEGLTEAIKKDGFNGLVIAYQDGDTYRLMSGHRTRLAAKNAGLKEIPTFVVPAPKDDIDRRKKLVGMNLHGRRYTPIRMAKEAQYQYETYLEEKKRAEEEGGEYPYSLLEQVAADLEISKSQVTKYRQLLKLLPELQEMADTGVCPWAALAAASQLTEEQQKALYSRITGQLKISGIGSVNSQYIKDEVDYCKRMNPDAYQYDANDTSLYSDELKDKIASPVKAKRRANRAVSIRKSYEMLENALGEDMILKEKDRNDVVQKLNSMKEMIDLLLAKVGS